MKLEYCQKTDIGLKRKRNEDFALIPADYADIYDTAALGTVFAIADGMGGHPAGNVASRIACQAFISHYYRASLPVRLFYRGLTVAACKPIAARIKAAIKEADKEICRHGCRHDKCEGLGTTLSVLVLNGKYAVIGHVGDSRIYRLRRGKLELLTQDHTFVQDLVDMGEITEQQARKNPMRHVLMQALGAGMDEIYTRCERLEPNDTFLLCSDGLHDMISDEEIAALLKKEIPIAQLCDLLVNAALEHGGKDNVTTIVVRHLHNKREK